MFRVVLTLLLLTTGWNGTAGGIVAVGPNPVAPNDRGEYVVLGFDEPTALADWSIGDGEAVVGLPDRTVSGRIVLTEEPALVEPWVTDPVVQLEGRLALANAGETVVLRHRGEVIDTVRYRRAPEGQRFVRFGEGWRWRQEGLTQLPPVRVGPTRARAFVLPDTPGVIAKALSGAEDRILVGAYTFTSPDVAATLCEARDRGVTVRMLADGGPVGGLTRQEARVLDRLAACGIRVTMLGGPYDRYEFHHAKYAVIDDSVLVMTENWKPSGVGGRSNRGWGVIVESQRAAAALAETFAADTGWRDAVPWRAYRVRAGFVEASAANGTFRRVHPAETVELSNATVLVTPDNAEAELVARFDSATDSIDVQQVSIGRPGNPLLRAVIRAAGRGVRVRILLSSAWYAREENRRLAEALTRRARQDGLPLSVRLVDPGGRFGKLHSKGIVIDRDVAIVGSINWNNNSLRRNREVAIVLRGGEAAAYYRTVFLADWRGGRWLVTVGVITAAVMAVVAVGLWARRSFTVADVGRRQPDPSASSRDR